MRIQADDGARALCLLLLLGGALLACSAESDAPAAEPPLPSTAGHAAAAPGAQVVTVPSEAGSPSWIAEREAQQRDSWQGQSTFHDFSFSDRRVASGISFVHQSTPDSRESWIPVHYDHGNSVSVADVDGDGHLDLFFATQLGRNGLWRNKGDGSFEDLTWTSMQGGLFDRVSVAGSFADADNDGDPDLLVTSVRGGNVFYENDGKGKFSDISKASGLDHVGHSSAAVWLDYDRDGLLDLFLLNVGRYTSDKKSLDGAYYRGLPDAFAGHVKPERAERHLLFRNKGDNRFEEVSESVGLVDETWAGAALPVDFNADGWVDLYIVNMQGLDQYWENVGGKKFVRRSKELFPRSSWGAMGAKAFDYDNDGDLDLYVTDMHSDMPVSFERDNMSGFSLADEMSKSKVPWPPDFLQDDGNGIFGNSFFRNDAGKFVEVSDTVGAENFWPWGLSAGDLNADGFQDVFVASSMNYPWRYAVNSLKLNQAGKRFADAEHLLGIEPRADGRLAVPVFTVDCAGAASRHKDCPQGARGEVTVKGAIGSRSSVLFDLDGDGDLDIVTNDFDSEPMVLVSNLSERKKVRHLSVSLEGTRSNRDGLGAVVSVVADGKRYTQVNDGQSGYLAQSRMPLYFGLGDATRVDEVHVRWPSGREQKVAAEIDSSILIREDS